MFSPFFKISLKRCVNPLDSIVWDPVVSAAFASAAKLSSTMFPSYSITSFTQEHFLHASCKNFTFSDATKTTDGLVELIMTSQFAGP